MRYLRLGFFHVLTFRPRNSPGLQAYSTPAYLGWYIRAAATSSRSVAHYAIGGVWSCAPPLRPRGRPGVFHRRAAPPHHRTAQVRGTPFFHVYCCSPYSTGRTRAGSRLPAWALPGFPFVLDYLVYASSASTSTRAVQRTLGGD